MSDYLDTPEYDAGYEDGRRDALNEVRSILSGESWNADHLDAITNLVIAAGFSIDPPGGEDA